MSKFEQAEIMLRLLLLTLCMFSAVFNNLIRICGALRDLVAFVQF